VPLLPEGTAVLLAPRVEVRSRGLHSSGEVAELVDVHCVFAVGVEALDGAGDADWNVYCTLTERDQSAYCGILRVEDADSVTRGLVLRLRVEEER
jgi:hypothetical protein